MLRFPFSVRSSCLAVLLLILPAQGSFALDLIVAEPVPVTPEQPLQPGPAPEPINPNNGSPECHDVDVTLSTINKTEAVYSMVVTGQFPPRYKHDTTVTHGGTRYNHASPNPCDTESYSEDTKTTGTYTPQFYSNIEEIGDACGAAELGVPSKVKNPKTGQTSPRINEYECSASPSPINEGRCRTTEYKRYVFGQTATTRKLDGIKWMLKSVSSGKTVSCVEHCGCAR